MSQDASATDDFRYGRSPSTPIEAFGTYDPNFENAFIGVGALRPFNGNPNAPAGAIAYGVTTACGVLFGDRLCPPIEDDY
jgi:hypothetical protein